MLSWIGANIGSILICLVLLAVVALILRSLLRQKKQGKSSCGCGCSSCPMSASCCNSGVGKTDESKNERGNSNK